MSEKNLGVSKTAAYFWLLLGSSLCVLAYLAWYARNFQLDDGLIYLRYFRNFFDGHGLVYNRGEYFNGLTSPLYAYLMLAVGTIIPDLQLTTVVLAFLSMAGALVLLGLYFRAQYGSALVTLGGLLGVALPYFYSNFGMETPLFMLMIAASLLLYQRQQYAALAVVSALLILTRAEGVFLPLALIVDHLLSKRPIPSLKILIAPALILCAHYIFNRVYFGSFLPATGSAKIWQGQSGLWGDDYPLFLHASYFYQVAFGEKPWLLGGIVLTAITGILAELRKSRAVILFFVFYLLFFSLLNIPNYGWYYAPYFLLVPYFSALGIVVIANFFIRKYPQRSMFIRAFLVVLVALPLFIVLMTFRPPSTPHAPYRQIGMWLNQNTKPTDSIAMVEIGTVGYYSERPIIDILGLVNPHNAEFIGRRQFDKWLEHYHPEYFLAHQPLWGHEVSIKRLVRRREVGVRPDFVFPGYMLYCRKGKPGCVDLPESQVPPERTLTMHSDGQGSATKLAGWVDDIHVYGSRLVVRGWVAHSARETAQAIQLVYEGTPPLSSQIDPIKRPDVVAHFGSEDYQDSGFEIELEFASSKEAKRVARHICLISESQTAGRLLVDSPRRECKRLIQPEAR